MSVFIGETGKSFLDRWSAIHFAAGVICGADFQAVAWPWWQRVAVGLVIAYLWELVEIVIEKKTGVVKHPEGPLNRWVSDPLMLVLGSAAGGFWIGGS